MVKITTSKPQQKQNTHGKQQKQNISIVKKDQQQLDNYEFCLLFSGLDEKISKKDVQTQILKGYNFKGIGHIGSGVFLVFTETEQDSSKIKKDFDQALINDKKIKVVQMLKRIENNLDNNKK